MGADAKHSSCKQTPRAEASGKHDFAGMRRGLERVMGKRSREFCRVILLGSILLVLAACGGGGGGGDSAAAATALRPASSEGPIAGFGSVIMNGVRWNTDDAIFEVEGRTGSQDDLSVGMVVRIEGRRSRSGDARADRVIFGSRLRGPVRAIEDLGPDTKLLEVFGIRAIVSRASTRFDRGTLDDLQLDEVVDLSGLTNELGELEVTHLRFRGRPVVGSTEVKAFGPVMGLAGGSFIIGTSEVRYDDSDLEDDLMRTGLREGLEVRVEGILLANDAIEATEIESQRRRGMDDDFDEVEFQGIVTDYVSISDFRVDGRPVDASAATLFPNEPELLRDGVRVEVEGRLDDAEVLIAEKLKFRSNRVRIEAALASDTDVDIANGEIVLLGILIQIDDSTRLRDQRDRVDGFGLEDIAAGDFLEIKGIAAADGTVTATQLERDRVRDVRLKGPIDMIDRDAEEFTILGTLVPTRSSTTFETDSGLLLSAAEFFDRVEAGSVVQAKDREDGDETSIDFADEVELEEPDLEDDDGDDGDDSPDSPDSPDLPEDDSPDDE